MTREDSGPPPPHPATPQASLPTGSVSPWWRRGLRRGGLAGDTAWATGGEVVQLVATLLIFYLLTTQLGPADYGYFAGAQALVATLATLSSAWVSLLLLQEVVRERRPAAEVFSSCLALAWVTGIAALLAALLLTPVLLPGVPVAAVLLLAVAELFGAGAVALSAAHLQATVSYPSSIRVRLLFVALRAVAVVALTLLGDVSLLDVATTYAAVSVVTGLATFGWVAVRHDVSLRPRMPAWAEWRSGMSYAGTLASFAVQEDSDKILLVRFADPAVAGFYAAGYRGVQMAVLPVRALLASSHRRFLEHDESQTGQHVRRSLRFTAPATAYSVLAVVALVVGAPLVPAILGEGYEQAAAVIPWLAPLVLLRAVSLFGFNGLMGLRRNGVRLAIVACTGLVAAVAAVVLIPLWSWQGAAAATVLSEVVFVALTWAALVHFQRRHDRSARSGAGRRKVAV